MKINFTNLNKLAPEKNKIFKKINHLIKTNQFIGGEEVIKFINHMASVKSLELGAIRGTFPAWEQSSYTIQENYRNACRLTVAPTGTISMIAGCTSGIEPLFALAWRKQNILEGQTLFYSNENFERDAQENGFYSEDLMLYLASGGSLQERDDVPDWVKDVYVTAQDISPEDHVLMQARFQQYVDSGISKTINFASEATLEDVFDAYMTAWETGCKGITVYRNGSREKEVLVTGHLEGEIARCDCESPLIFKKVVVKRVKYVDGVHVRFRKKLVY